MITLVGYDLSEAQIYDLLGYSGATISYVHSQHHSNIPISNVLGVLQALILLGQACSGQTKVQPQLRLPTVILSKFN